MIVLIIIGLIAVGILCLYSPEIYQGGNFFTSMSNLKGSDLLDTLGIIALCIIGTIIFVISTCWSLSAPYKKEEQEYNEALKRHGSMPDTPPDHYRG